MATIAAGIGTTETRLQRLAEVLLSGVMAFDEDEYLHWDDLIGRDPPAGLSQEEWWTAIKYARAPMVRMLPMDDRDGMPMHYTLPDPLLSRLHDVEMLVPEEVLTMPERMIEEALASSRLHDAAIDRGRATRLCLHRQSPASEAERILVSEFASLVTLSEQADTDLSANLLTEFWRSVSGDDSGTGLQRPLKSGKRVAQDSAGERLAIIFQFANESNTDAFLRPLIKALILRYAIRYEAPLISLNEEVALLAFRWSMMRTSQRLVPISGVMARSRLGRDRAFMMSVSDDADTTYYVMHQLDRLRDGLMFRNRQNRKQESQLRQFKSSGSTSTLNPRQLSLLSRLGSAGRVTIAEHQAACGTVYETARTDLQELERGGHLRLEKLGRAFTYVPSDPTDERL